MAWVVYFRPVAPDAIRSSDDVDLLVRYEILISGLWERGMTGIGQRTVDGHQELTAGFADRSDAEAAAVLAAGHGLAADLSPADEIWYPTETSSVTIPFSDVDPFIITAGASFGHGGHPTTALALELLGHLDQHPGRVLDLGTGSGVLAIAAGLLGAKEVVAIDIDPVAVSIAADNAAANRVLIETTTDTAAELARRGQQFDLILANVLVTVHQQVAAAVRGMLAPGGRLIVSGFLDDQADRVRRAYRGVIPGLEVERSRIFELWRAETLIRPTTAAHGSPR